MVRKKVNVGERQLHSDLEIGQSPPLGNDVKSKSFYLDEHFICDGEVKICRTRQSGKNYQMIMWIKGEKKHFRQSLRESDLETAKLKGKEIYQKLMSQIYQGNKIFSLKMSELVEMYLEHQQTRVDEGLITQGRHITIKSMLKHLVEFVEGDTKVDSIQNTKYRHYYRFRRENHPKVQNITLKNERSQIGNLYKWGIDEGYVNLIKIPKWSELKFSKPKSRYYLDRTLYRKLYTFLNRWDRGINDPEELYYRKLVRDFILVLSNTGMRFGECRKIRWEYVQLIPSKKKYPNVKILIPEHITKTKTERTTLGMRGDIFQRIKTYSGNILSHDYVFTNYKDNEPVNKRILYKYWNKIMEGSGLCDEPVPPTYYTLRHTFISYRIMYGNVNVFTLGKLVGTGVQYIQDHYGHLNLEDISEDYTKIISKDEMDDMFGQDLEL